MAGVVSRSFGTWRGGVRLALSYVQLAAGMAAVRAPEPAAIRRLVFVCHGNICRSPFGEEIARQTGYRTASFGLSTASGKPAHPPVAAQAAAMGHDLSAHRSTALADFRAAEGDLLVAMEVRHLHRLAADPVLGAFPRVLLGSYLPVPVPHLHDPYMIAEDYLPTCLDRIENAVRHLCRSFPAAGTS